MFDKICRQCGNADNIVEDPVKGLSFCEIHKVIITDTYIQNQVEFNTAGQAMGTLMPKGGGIQPMIRPGGANNRGAATVLSGDARQQRVNKFYRIID